MSKNRRVKIGWWTISYFILFFGCLFFAALSLHGKWDPKTSSGEFFPALFLGMIASMLASGVLMLFITWRDSKRLANIDSNVERLAPLADQIALDEVEAVLRNADVPREKWVSLIADLHSDADPVYFVGTSLRRWRERQEYSVPLIEKLHTRLEKSKSQTRKKVNSSPRFQTFFCLIETQAVGPWEKFIAENVLHEPDANLADYGVHIVTIAPSTPYSAVCSSKRLAVTPYTANRNVEESLSIFLRRTGLLYGLYFKDIATLSRTST